MRTFVHSTLLVAAAVALGACKTDSYVPNARPPATQEPGTDVGGDARDVAPPAQTVRAPRRTVVIVRR